jgi:hypothetical protein
MDETEIAGRLASVESRCKSNSHRLDGLEKNTEALNHLATSVAVMAEKMEATGDKVDGLCNDVKDLKAEPGKKWKFVIEKSIYIAVSAVIGFILAKFGLG